MNRKWFDGTLLIVLLSKPAFGLVKMASARWSQECNGALGTIGDAAQVAL